LNGVIGSKQGNPDFWNLGKILNYSLQEEPFIHLDNDLYLWSALPERLARAVIAQNPEGSDNWGFVYRPELLQQAIRAVSGWVPAEISAYPRAGVPRGARCGILGVDFLRH
jgi:hypothetical protein